MKASLYLVIFIISIQFGFTQNYELIDKKVLNYPEFKTLNTLSIRIQNDFDTDAERVRAIYTWLTNSIHYDLEKAYKPRQAIVYKYRTQKEFETQKRTYQETRMLKAFETKKAVCIDFSLLFTELCTLLSIESRVIRGVTKVNVDEINTLRHVKDHAWNAVKLNESWQLIDVTWSTGFEDVISKEWIKSFNDFFYLTPSEYFITSHYPEKNVWQLIENPISLDHFFSLPIFYPSYYKSDALLTKDHKGSILVSDNHIVINFKRKSSKGQLYYTLSGDNFTRSVRLKRTKENTFYANIKYKDKSDTILTLYLDQDAILDFKIIAQK